MGEVRCSEKVYCAYCGKEIQPDSEIDHGEVRDYYHCDCEDALKEIEIIKKIASLERDIQNLRRELSETKYGITMEMKVEKKK